MATDLEFRELLATAEKLYSLIDKSNLSESEERDAVTCSRLLNAFITNPSVDQRVPAVKDALMKGCTYRSITFGSPTGESIHASVGKSPDGLKYKFSLIVDSEDFENEDECVRALVTYLKEL